ncbi:hypothetical protein WICPIJ_008218 [Wickerhamomyces pijperi]|uniref:Uncharacterized protein n=1 Tax=Wickerhamomyces pijperi TaxID=599730 RepID=A0A9P8TIA7_WICPI|nr:hypothetical protein WICPIJ_008218 [Wickerhamomyces pijperi]
MLWVEESLFLVDECEGNQQVISNSGGPLGTTGIWRNNNTVLIVWDLSLDVMLQDRFAVQVVNTDVKETLELGVVQVHSDDVVCTGFRQQFSDQSP